MKNNSKTSNPGGESTEIPKLWDPEEDSYTDVGYDFITEVESAIDELIAPLVESGADIVHVQSFAVEAVSKSCERAWLRRNNHLQT